MVHAVRVRHIGDFKERVTEIRAWLDKNAIKPRFFEHSSGGPGTAFSVAFEKKADAEAFAEAFHGHVLRDDPHGNPLWIVPSKGDHDHKV